jgi:hypothetical protein
MSVLVANATAEPEPDDSAERVARAVLVALHSALPDAASVPFEVVRVLPMLGPCDMAAAARHLAGLRKPVTCMAYRWRDLWEVGAWEHEPGQAGRWSYDPREIRDMERRLRDEAGVPVGFVPCEVYGATESVLLDADEFAHWTCDYLMLHVWLRWSDSCGEGRIKQAAWLGKVGPER